MENLLYEMQFAIIVWYKTFEGRNDCGFVVVPLTSNAFQQIS